MRAFAVSQTAMTSLLPENTYINIAHYKHIWKASFFLCCFCSPRAAPCACIFLLSLLSLSLRWVWLRLQDCFPALSLTANKPIFSLSSFQPKQPLPISAFEREGTETQHPARSPTKGQEASELRSAWQLDFPNRTTSLLQHFLVGFLAFLLFFFSFFPIWQILEGVFWHRSSQSAGLMKSQGATAVASVCATDKETKPAAKLHCLDLRAAQRLLLLCDTALISLASTSIFW